MYHFLKYNKKTGMLIGSCKASSIDCLPNSLIPEEAYLEITEKKDIETINAMNFRKERLKGKISKNKIEQLKVEPIFQGKIELSTDAVDADNDGIPELPADGKTSAELRATILDLHGNIMTKKPILTKFQISRGIVSKREEQTINGIAVVQLTSSIETTQTEITVSAPGFQSDTIIIEFIPVEEFQMLNRPQKKK